MEYYAENEKTTYYDATNEILGCEHYQRSCKLLCPECVNFYTCHHCHDEKIHDHSLSLLKNNSSTKILCMNCNLIQSPSNSCFNCDNVFANYFCSVCNLYDDDINRNIYHCKDCGICRLGYGLGIDYYHCKGCNACISIDLKDNHKCILDTVRSDCPICGEYLFNSIKTVFFMKCGHSIHKKCFNKYVENFYKCPLCLKSIIDMENQFRILDHEISHQILPHPYSDWKCIVFCNDCTLKSSCKFHIIGLKCSNCGSYNT
ncbi:RING finger and CHY zinc finger domain-containing protein, partial [Ascoidea rubescens DSM 1968]